MCGIVGAVAKREVSEILLEGLRRLEYRGYDSAGMAVLEQGQNIMRTRRLGKVQALSDAIQDSDTDGVIGIAHTRWATHGKPSEENAHPQMSNSHLAVVHNGIIENYVELKDELLEQGVEFESETDSEVISHLIYYALRDTDDLLTAVQATVEKLTGAYAIAVLSASHPDQLVVARQGSPLVIGIGIGENFIASDQMALLPVTDRFVFLEEGDVALVTCNRYEIRDSEGQVVGRDMLRFDHRSDAADKGEYRHYMLKEIYEQPRVIRAALEGRISENHLLEQAFGAEAAEILDNVKAVQIVACGTSYHSGLVAKYWLESMAKIPCQVEVASEYRYRESVILPNTLFITISQSGETADTLAALKGAKEKGVEASLAICNVAGSSLVRESDLSIMTNAGPEIGVASTKAFTTQLSCLMLVSVALAKRNGMTEAQEQEVVSSLHALPDLIQETLQMDDDIKRLSEEFADKNHSLFLGRGSLYPIAMEGALKLKEISYIHAESYPAGELKHGPLALVDEEMPIVTVAPRNDLLEKLKANLEVVRARGGILYVFADETVKLDEGEGCKVLSVPKTCAWLEPILYVVPLQLLSYHVALLKGTDVDQPRNLAKSVTVE